MNTIAFLKQNKDRWWALPLILPVVLLPVLSAANTLTQLGDGIVALYYLPLFFLLTLMLFFGVGAIPGIVLSLFIRYYPQVGLFETIAGIFHFIIPLVLSWGGYRVFAPRRNMTAYGDIRLMAQRIFWQVLCPATLFLVLFQFAVYLGVYESRQSTAGLNPLNIHTLINYQALLVSGLTGVPLSYLIIRLIRHPRYFRALISQSRAQIDKKVTLIEFLVWLIILGGLLLLLLIPMNENSSIFTTNYTLSLLMPVMLWGAMRFGYRLTSLIWTPVLLVSIHYFYRYIPVNQGYDIQLAITSSSYLVFSFVVVYMSMLSTRQRAVNKRSAGWRSSTRLSICLTCGRCYAIWPGTRGRRSVYCVFLNWKYWAEIMAYCCEFYTNSSWHSGLMAHSSPMSGCITLPGMIWRCDSTRNRTSSESRPRMSISNSSVLSGMACRYSRRWA